MNSSNLVLQPSGHPDVSPSSAARATAPNANNSTGSSDDGSGFAGVLKAAGPKASRKPLQSKTADEQQAGGNLPNHGNTSPPPPVPHAGMHGAVTATTGAGSKQPDSPEGARAITGPGSAGRTPAVGSTVTAANDNDSPASAVTAAAAASRGGVSPVAPGPAGTPAADAAAHEAAPSAVADATATVSTAATAAAPAAEVSVDATTAGASVTPAGQMEQSGAQPAAAVATAADVKSIPLVASAAAAAPAPKGAVKTAVAASRSGAAKTAGNDGTNATRTGADSGSTPAPETPGLLLPPTNAASAGDGASGASNSSAAAAAAAALAAVAPTATDSNAAPPAAGLGVDRITAAAGTGTAANALAAAPTAVSAQSKDAAALLTVDKDKVDCTAGDPPGPRSGDSAAGLAQLTSIVPASGSGDASPTPTVRIHASVDSAEFAQGLSDRVSWMVGNGLNGAKLQVNPPQLGPIELRIAVNGDHAQVWMTTHSAVTRDALESGAPQLRDMLSAQGFGQVSVDISQRSFQDRSAYPQPYERTAPQRSAAAAPVVSAAATISRPAAGALDAYA